VNQTEDYTPSLLAGLVRYKRRVAVAVVLFGLLGALYAWSSWKPQAAMTVVVQVSNSTAAGNNPDRTTSEVAAKLSSPEVIANTEDLSGVTVDTISTSWAQGQSTVGVLVAAASPEDASAAADKLIEAYDKAVSDDAQATLDAKSSTINASLGQVQSDLDENAAQLGAVTAGTTQAQILQNQRDTLVSQRTDLQNQLSQASLEAATPSATVALASGPDKGPSRLSLLMRYVPAALVAGLLICMAVVAVVERRRPWLADPEMGSRLMQAPLLGVGPGPRGVSTRHGTDAVAPVVAMSVLRAVGNAPTGIALLVSRGGPEVGDGAAVLARDMTPVLERAGAKVAVLAVAASGRTFLLAPDGVEEEIEGLWSEFSGREEFEGTLRGFGIDADLVVLVPVVDIEHEVLLDLVLLADVTVVATRTGTLLEPLFALRRDFDAIGREPHGVVADLAVR
jgi:hypothetical protein